MNFAVEVVVTTPSHAGLGATLSYHSAAALSPGSVVRVPLGRREVPGVVWACAPTTAIGEAGAGSAIGTTDNTQASHRATKAVLATLEQLPPLNDRWCQLVAFTARYYQRSLGEVALAALPPQLRELDAAQLQRKLKKLERETAVQRDQAPTPQPPPELTTEQAAALAALEHTPRPVLLFGATGSGKTEVYLRAVQHALDANPQAQALVMVPEINLTPQLEARFNARFGALGVVSLHSGLTPAQRLNHWLQAHLGQARIVLGTRMAVFASLPHLRLIVVDEEHDPSYKSQEGARYSARDLAVYRGKLESDMTGQHCRVVLGSATPSLESWHAAEQGRYLRLNMPERMGGGALPRLRLVDMNQQPKKTVLAPPLVNAMRQRIARGEQVMVLLNRRGYAPVLTCHDCGWKSDCPHCSAHAVFHKIDRTLRCHHCGHTVRVPAACPECGNLDIAGLGRGTEQMEEHLAELLADVQRPDGGPVRVLRVDADSTRHKGSLEQHLDDMHAGDVDVLVGTQMIAKGHDFRRITLVACLNADSGLFASDYRAPERLFALLMQAAGRAGRDAAFVNEQGSQVELWVPTWHPDHPLFAALARHDYPAFAAQQLEERVAAQMPPFGYQALVRAEAHEQSLAQAFLTEAASASTDLPGRASLMLYPAVPTTIQRVANVERTQMLVEGTSRPDLLRFLHHWQAVLHELRRQPAFKRLLRWAIDVDPLSI